MASFMPKAVASLIVSAGSPTLTYHIEAVLFEKKLSLNAARDGLRDGPTMSCPTCHGEKIWHDSCHLASFMLSSHSAPFILDFEARLFKKMLQLNAAGDGPRDGPTMSCPTCPGQKIWHDSCQKLWHHSCFQHDQLHSHLILHCFGSWPKSLLRRC